MSPRNSLSSLKRGLKALSLLNVRETLTASSLASELNLPRTTARRILDTLVEEGYVEKIEAEHVYRLTAMVNLLSSGFSDESWISHVAEPLLVRTTVEIGWPLCIATPKGEYMMNRISTDRLTPLALDHFAIGFTTPMLHGTSGHVMLAFMPSHHQAQLLQILRMSSDPRQALAREDERIRGILKTVRAQGFAHIIYGEYPEASIGVPVFLDGTVRACLLMVYLKTARKPADVRATYLPVLQKLSANITAEVREARARHRTSTVRLKLQPERSARRRKPQSR